MVWPGKPVEPLIQSLPICVRKMKKKMVGKLPPSKLLEENSNPMISGLTLPFYL
jgi:hypothetical protein